MSDLPMSYTEGHFTFGLVGHRAISDPAAITRMQTIANTYFTEWKRHYPQLVALSLLDAGADSVLVRDAQAHGADLIAVVPFTAYAAGFSGAELTTYQTLLASAKQVEQISEGPRSDEAYLAAGRWIVDHSYAILAAWDGEPALGADETADIIKYANAQKKPVFVINTRANAA